MGVSGFRPHSFHGLRGQVSDVFAPVLSTVSLPFQRSVLFFHDVMGLAQLQADNQRLEQENIRLREWYQTALLLDSENKSLRALLNFEADPKLKTITGRVISDAGNTYVKSLLVNIGQHDGVKKGAAVLSVGGLIGRIVEVSDNTARILLLTDINSRVPVMVADTGQHAIMAGGNKRDPRLIHLPQDSEVSAGGRVITSGFGGVYPHGLAVGRVIEDASGGFEVELFADFEKIQIVRILQFDDGA